MVRSWNREPSPDLPRAPRDGGQLSPRSPTVRFHPGERFAFDGKPRLPNFLNGFDGQMGEARGAMRPADTCTHTSYDYSSAGTGNANVSMAAEMARSMNSCSALRAGRSKSSTARSLVAGDTRYSHLADPHGQHVGPGAYAVERALPGVGPMLPDSHTSSSQPQRDPYRASAPFLGPERPSSANWVLPSGPDVVYTSPDYVPANDRAAPWECSKDARPDTSDWRFGHSRVMSTVAAARGSSASAGVGLGREGEGLLSSDCPLDVSGRPLEVSLRAGLRNGATCMRSQEPRMLALPAERHVDLRAARYATANGVEETAHLGPGSYLPFTSVGSAKRRTYRVFVNPFEAPQPAPTFMGGMQADAAAVVHAHGHAARSRANAVGGSGGASARSNTTMSSSASFTTPRGGARLAPSSAFSTPFRSQKSGAHDWTTDSRLVRH